MYIVDMTPQVGRQLSFNFGFTVVPALRLKHVEQILRQSRAITPVPSRQNLIMLIESGVLRGKPTNYGWVVYEDSLIEFVKSLQPEQDIEEQTQKLRSVK